MVATSLPLSILNGRMWRRRRVAVALFYIVKRENNFSAGVPTLQSTLLLFRCELLNTENVPTPPQLYNNPISSFTCATVCLLSSTTTTTSSSSCFYRGRHKKAAPVVSDEWRTDRTRSQSGGLCKKLAQRFTAHPSLLHHGAVRLGKALCSPARNLAAEAEPFNQHGTVRLYLYL